MTIAITVIYRNSKTTIFTDDYMVADNEWNKAKAQLGKDVANVSGGIVCCTVPLGARHYTYFCDKLYKHGTKVIVPTPWGDKIVPVLESRVITKQELQRIAEKNGFSYNNYKDIIGIAK